MSLVKRLDSLSTKVKTMVLTLGCFVVISIVFSTLRYLDLKDSLKIQRQNYSLNINSFYKMQKQRANLFYFSRLEANLQSFGIKQALKEKDKARLLSLSSKRFLVLQKENKYILDMIFYDCKFNVLQNLNSKASLAKKIPASPSQASGFIEDKSRLYYYILKPAYKKDKLIGYIALGLDPEYFIAMFKSFMNAKGFIFKGKEPRMQDLKQDMINQIFVTHKIHIFKDFYLIFLQDISKQVSSLNQSIYEAFLISSVLMVVIFAILNYGFNILIKRLEKSEDSLKALNQDLEFKISQEIEKRFQNEQLLMHQSRFASMGEMIGNIAHQWRQPLTSLNANLMHIGLLNELERLDAKELSKAISSSEELIIFMSNTIDDFRNFFSVDVAPASFCVNASIKSVIKLLQASFKNHNIKISFKASSTYYIKGYANQFSQACLNILSNAKDVLLERKIQDPTIEIILQDDLEGKNAKNLIRLSFGDNAGGVSILPKEKIFEPYVTSKHASSGTGIGLYMTKTIIEKNFKSFLSVENGYILEDPSLKGAIFTMLLSRDVSA